VGQCRTSGSPTHFQLLLRVLKVFFHPRFLAGVFFFIFVALTTLLLQYTLAIEAMPCPRPRLGRYGNTHNTPKYVKYKKDMVWLLKSLHIPKADYKSVSVDFYFAYPVSTPKKHRIDNSPAVTRYDLDNLLKGFLDSLQDATVIDNDRAITTILTSKCYTTEPRGRIWFHLL